MIDIAYTWTADEVMKPLARFASLCREKFVVGRIYTLEIKERSEESHDHYFACLHKAWLHLPESVEKEFTNETGFRKWALIEAGYFDETRFQFSTNEEAERFVGFCIGLDQYAEIHVAGSIVAIRKAKSQKKKLMGNRDFQASKSAVFDVIAKLIGVSPAELGKNVGWNAREDAPGERGGRTAA